MMQFHTIKEREDFITKTLAENTHFFDDKEKCDEFEQACRALELQMDRESLLENTAYDATVHMLQGFFLEVGRLLARSCIEGKDYRPLMQAHVMWILRYARGLRHDVVVTLHALEDEDGKRPE